MTGIVEITETDFRRAIEFKEKCEYNEKKTRRYKNDK